MADSKAKLSFSVAATGADLALRVTLDDKIIYHSEPGTEPTVITHEFDDGQEGPHVLVFEMTGKLPSHTVLDAHGTITQDRCIMITDLAFDDIQLGHMFTAVARYSHDHNGTTEPITEAFYGVMGCNGRVTVEFSTPIYLWLLENM